jgi:hypothetical protein
MAQLPVRTGPSAFVGRQLDALSPRDRLLLVGLLGFGATLFVSVFGYGAYKILDNKAAAVKEVKKEVVEMQQLQQAYNASAATFEAHEDQLRNKQPVSTFVEGLASKHDITDQLSNINAQGNPEVVGALSQQRYTVELQKAPQENIFRFLYDLETSGYPASVEQAVFKSVKTKDGVMMTLTLDLMVLSVAEG